MALNAIPTSTPEYVFAVLDEKRRSFALTFSAADERAKGYFQSVWKRMSEAIKASQGTTGAAPDWCKWSPWDWCLSSKPESSGREMVVAWCGDRMAGFLSLRPGFASQTAAGKQTLYIEHLGAFPGDIETATWGRRYRGVGMALLAYAIHASTLKGFEGLLSLHASNAEALMFYRAVAKKVKDAMALDLFHPERNGVVGPTPYGASSDPGKTYLETTVAGSSAWLGEYRNA